VLDLVLLGVFYLAYFISLRGLGVGHAIAEGTTFGVAAWSGVFYFCAEGRRRGQTLGKRVFRIRVVSIATAEPIGVERAFVRQMGKVVSAACLMVGFAWMLRDRERQCWHDKLVRDIVVPVAAYPVRQSRPLDPPLPKDPYIRSATLLP
jgi:uncharacterized RDD family membrane protein YckC